MRPEVWDGERRSLASRLRGAAANLDLAAHFALEVAGIGAWDIVPATREARWSARAKLLLGFSPDEQVTLEQCARALKPADRDRLSEASLRVIEPDGDSSFHVELSLAGDGTRWLALAGAAYVDGDARVHLVGTIKDVTAEKLRQIRLAELRHDVRGQLHGMALAAELVRNRPAAEATELLSRVNAMAKRAERMLDQLLPAAPSEDDPLPLRPTGMALADVCAAVIADLGLAHRGRKVGFHAASACRGEWDRDRLYQLVRNLVVNAVEHGEPDSPIEVALAEDVRFAVLTVENRGTAPSEREEILDPLRSNRWKRDGRGLGLHIVKQIAAEHGGSFELITDDQRTLVRVKLPKRVATRRDLPRGEDS
jgi:phosphoserine phosphatase RsbU/P